MNGPGTQEERLDYLVREFAEDSEDYKDIEIPRDTEGKRRILRSLMNIRMPRGMDAHVIDVQDRYLQERIRPVMHEEADQQFLKERERSQREKNEAKRD